MQDKMKLINLDIERAHRIGQRDNNRPRTIIARFTHFRQREDVLRNAFKLKGTRVFVNEDLCPASQEKIKAQLPLYKQARAEGKVAFFPLHSACCEGETYTRSTPAYSS